MNRKYFTNLQKFLLDRPQQVESWLDLGLRVLSLHTDGDHCNEPTLGGHLVGVGHAGDVDVALPPHYKQLLVRRGCAGGLMLFLRQDELSRQSVLGVWDGMIQQADTPHNFPSLLDCFLTAS